MGKRILTDWISATEAAELIGVSCATLRRWRAGGSVIGPAYNKNPGGANARVQYRRSAVLQWIKQQEVSADAS